jgi:hypothetical protein
MSQDGADETIGDLGRHAELPGPCAAQTRQVEGAIDAGLAFRRFDRNGPRGNLLAKLVVAAPFRPLVVRKVGYRRRIQQRRVARLVHQWDHVGLNVPRQIRDQESATQHYWNGQRGSAKVHQLSATGLVTQEICNNLSCGIATCRLMTQLA